MTCWTIMVQHWLIRCLEFPSSCLWVYHDSQADWWPPLLADWYCIMALTQLQSSPNSQYTCLYSTYILLVCTCIKDVLYQELSPKLNFVHNQPPFCLWSQVIILVAILSLCVKTWLIKVQPSIVATSTLEQTVISTMAWSSHNISQASFQHGIKPTFGPSPTLDINLETAQLLIQNLLQQKAQLVALINQQHVDLFPYAIDCPWTCFPFPSSEHHKLLHHTNNLSIIQNYLEWAYHCTLQQVATLCAEPTHASQQVPDPST